jgi:hypothetical protein
MPTYTWNLVRVQPTLPYTYPYIHHFSLLNVNILSPRSLHPLHASYLPSGVGGVGSYSIIVMTCAVLDCMISHTAIKKCVIPHLVDVASDGFLTLSPMEQASARGFKLSNTRMPSSKDLIRPTEMFSASAVHPVYLACLTLNVCVSSS